MIIMCDIHGCLDNPKFRDKFSYLFDDLCLGKNKIIICSGSPEKKMFRELEKLGFLGNIHEIISIHDYLISKGYTFEYDDNGNPWIEDDIWWRSKAWIAEEYSVDIVIDDRIEYAKYMNPKVLFLHVRR